MVSEKATLVNPQGLHMRPAGLFASTMGKYACDVTVVTPESSSRAVLASRTQTGRMLNN